MSGGLRVCLLGETGTIGRAAAASLRRRGHEVVALGREVDLADPAAVQREGFRGARFDAVLSCMASRTGVPADAWAVDHRAHLGVLEAARRTGIDRFVLLSALCVQRPRLAFQHAKLAFEAALRGSGLAYAIVRPTAFFKSLSGQVERVRAGQPYLVFGDGRMTSCKPISDADLAAFLVACVEAPGDRVLPIGGPGPAITPREQGEALFALLGRPARFRHVPVAVLDGVAGMLSAGALVVPALAAKAELARIGRYYATESMLVWDPVAGRYDAAATPETGGETLFEYWRGLLAGGGSAERGAHAVF